jgi:predicted transport protein
MPQELDNSASLQHRSTAGAVAIEEHAGRGDRARRQLFLQLREAVLKAIPDTIENPLKGYIGYGLDLTRTSRLKRTFLQVEVHADDVLLYLRPINYRDPRGLVAQAPSARQWTCDRLVRLHSVDEVNYTMHLIQQSYEDVS